MNKTLFFVVDKQSQRLIAGAFGSITEADAWMTKSLTDEQIKAFEVSMQDEAFLDEQYEAMRQDLY